jgi:hypothetical protein
MQAAVMIHRMLWWKGVHPCAAMQASCCHDPQNGWKKVLPCAAMQARCCDSQNACARKVCYPALPCKQAAVIHRIWWKRVCYPCAAMQARCCCDSQNAWWKKVCYPCAAMQARCCCDPQNACGRCAIPQAATCSAAVVILNECLVCYPLAVMHASCCHDPQNALVEEGVLSLRCHASSLL